MSAFIWKLDNPIRYLPIQFENSPFPPSIFGFSNFQMNALYVVILDECDGAWCKLTLKCCRLCLFCRWRKASLLGAASPCRRPWPRTPDRWSWACCEQERDHRWWCRQAGRHHPSSLAWRPPPATLPFRALPTMSRQSWKTCKSGWVTFSQTELCLLIYCWNNSDYHFPRQLRFVLNIAAILICRESAFAYLYHYF